MTPSVGLRGASDAASRVAVVRRSSSTMGDSGERSSRSSKADTWQSSRAPSSDGYIKAKGFSSRCLRARIVATACSLRASTIS